MHKKVIRGVTYYYTSVREDGRIKTIYLGRTKNEAKRREAELKGIDLRPVPRTWTYVGLAVVIIAILIFGGNLIGYMVSVTEPTELTGEFEVEVTFQAGSFLPRNAVIEISLENQTSRITLEDFLRKSGSELVLEEENFYSSEVRLSGYGEGYGIKGEKISYPNVTFQFNLSAYELIIMEIPYNATNITTILVNETIEVFNETLNTTVNETVLVNKTVEENITLYNTTEELVLLESGVFNGSCTFENPYLMNASDLIYQHRANYSVSLVSGSVRIGNKTLNDSYVSLELKDGIILVETSYYESDEGYGKKFTGRSRIFSLNLSEIGIGIPDIPGEYTVITKLIYNDSILEETSRKITLVREPPECRDNDGDGYYTCREPIDCNDSNPDVSPVMNETCDDGIDNNCDGLIDEEDTLCKVYVNNTINGGSGTTCDDTISNPCLYIQDYTGTIVARFDGKGNVDIKGGYNVNQTSPLSCSNCFQIKDSRGALSLYIDSSGNLYAKGYFYKQSNPSPSRGNDFIIKDSGGTVVGYIDGATGNMYFKGDLHYNSDF